jgi:hypothetical protein
MSAAEDRKLDTLPEIDLDKLVDCSFNYSFDPLKKALAYLLKANDQSLLLKRIADLENKVGAGIDDKNYDDLLQRIDDLENLIEELRESMSHKTEKDNSALFDQFKELEYELKILTEKISNNKVFFLKTHFR